MPSTSGMRYDSRAKQRTAKSLASDKPPPMSRDEADIIRLANVPFDGWQKEKEKRCEVAFNRIIEHDWYDKFEGNMSMNEMIHVNAVREHYAMRRDKIKTPAEIPLKGTNTISCLDWAADMEAIEQLNRDTGVSQGFRQMMLKKATARAKERGHDVHPSLFMKSGQSTPGSASRYTR